MSTANAASPITSPQNAPPIPNRLISAAAARKVISDASRDLASAMALARLDSPGLEAALVAGLGNGDPAVRMNSALALGFGRKKDALDPLLVALATETDVEVKRGMIRALGELGLPGAAPGLRRASEVDSRVAAEAEAALRRLPAAPAP